MYPLLMPPPKYCTCSFSNFYWCQIFFFFSPFLARFPALR